MHGCTSPAKVVEVKSRARELLPIMFALIFVNAVAPAGGAGGRPAEDASTRPISLQR